MSYDIQPHWGSHGDMLIAALESLPSGSLVIDHGAGIYSTPMISHFDVHVICVEDEPGWRSWASWMYSMRGREAEVIARGKSTVSRMPEASLVFIDGVTRERGDVLKWALAAEVPTIIAHDTEDDAAGMYGWPRHLFDVGGYTVTHDGVRPRTTMWRLA